MQTRMPTRTPLSRQAQRGGAVTLGLIGLAVVVLAGALFWFFSCPCERTPGAVLWGEEAEQPVADWSFANQVPLCQIQTSTGLLPHAINLNCMASSSGQLYLSCSECDGKRWSSAALENPEARIRLDGIVYPVTLRRVTSQAELDRAWVTRYNKLSGGADGGGEVPARPDHWWSFEVSSRSG